MKKWCLVICVAIVFPTVNAQVKNTAKELGLFLGVAYYTGDLNPTHHFRLAQPALGGVYRYTFNPRISSRINLLYGTIRADDQKSDDPLQLERRLHFRSRVIELSGQIEFNFQPYLLGDEHRAFSPYMFLGFGAFNFDPQAQIQNEWVRLQPIGTEGQGTDETDKKNYRLTQFSVPFGAGVKAHVAKRMGITFEWGMRKTFTDYLDDVSTVYVDPVFLTPQAAVLSNRSRFPGITGGQRGNSLTKDWYNFTGVILTFLLTSSQEKCPSAF